MRQLTDKLLKTLPLAQPDADTDKNKKGRVLVVAGSAGVPGAALLTANAALRAGAGKVQIAAPKGIATALGMALPEAGIVSLAEDRRGDPRPLVSAGLKASARAADAIVVGPGLSNLTSATTLALKLLESSGGAGIVIDAGCIGGLLSFTARIKAARRPVVITPHHGEMASLIGCKIGEIDRRPEHFARLVAQRLRCVVALKGAQTLIASPDDEMWVFDGALPGLAVSGSGDVLCGIIGGLMGRGTDAVRAVLWAVMLHAKAGRQLSRSIGPAGFLASELLPILPGLLR